MSGQELALRAEMKRMGGEMVPIWNGSLEDWEDYTVRAGIYCRGVEGWKVGSRIANLIQSLEGKAWDAIRNLSENERISLQQNLPAFLNFLKEQCLPTAIPELGRRFKEWQKFRRLRKETMRVYIKRYRLQMNRLEMSMRTVDNGSKALDKLRRTIAVQRMLLTAVKTPSVHSRNSQETPASNRSFRTRTTPAQSPSPPNSPPRGLPRNWTSRQRQEERPDPQEEEREEEDGEWERVSQQGRNQSWWQGWHNQGWDWGTWRKDESSSSVPKPLEKPLSPIEELAKAFAQLEIQVGMNDPVLLELQRLVAERWRENALPSILTGWHLLNGSGLNATERSAIIATASMSKRDDESLESIDLNAMEKALQLAWPDTELVERDEKVERKEDRRGKKGRAFLVDSSDSETEEKGYRAESKNIESDNSSDMDEQDAQLIADLSDEEERDELANAIVARSEGKRMMNQGRRTFMQAKTLIRDIRRTRGKPKFYPKPRTAHLADELINFVTKNKRTTRSSSQPSRPAAHKNQKSGPKLCFKCGLPDHEFKDCTKKTSSKANLAIEDCSMADDQGKFNELVAAKEARIRELRRQLEQKRLAQLEAEERELEAELNTASKTSNPPSQASSDRAVSTAAKSKDKKKTVKSRPQTPAPKAPAKKKSPKSTSTEESSTTSSSERRKSKRKRNSSDRGRESTRSSGRHHRKKTTSKEKKKRPEREHSRQSSPPRRQRSTTPPQPEAERRVRNRWNQGAEHDEAYYEEQRALVERLQREEQERRRAYGDFVKAVAKAPEQLYVSEDVWEEHFRSEKLVPTPPNRPPPMRTPVKSPPVPLVRGRDRPKSPVRPPIFKRAPDHDDGARWKPAPPFKAPPPAGWVPAPWLDSGNTWDNTGTNWSAGRHSWDPPPPKAAAVIPPAQNKWKDKEKGPRELSTYEMIGKRQAERREQKEAWEKVGYKGHAMYEEPAAPENFLKTSDAWQEAFDALPADAQAEVLRQKALRAKGREERRAERTRLYGECSADRKAAGVKLQHQRRSRLEMITCPIWDKAIRAIPADQRWHPQHITADYSCMDDSMFLYTLMCYRHDILQRRQESKERENYQIFCTPSPLAHQAEDYDPEEPEEDYLLPYEANLSEILRTTRSHREFRYLATVDPTLSQEDREFLQLDYINICRNLRRHFYEEIRAWNPPDHNDWQQMHRERPFILNNNWPAPFLADLPEAAPWGLLENPVVIQEPYQLRLMSFHPLIDEPGVPRDIRELSEEEDDLEPKIVPKQEKPEPVAAKEEAPAVIATESEIPSGDMGAVFMVTEEVLIGESSTDAVLTVDCGATGSLLSLHTLDLWDKEGLVNIANINPEVQKRYKVANGQSVLTCSQIDMTFVHRPELGLVTFDCTESDGVPPLLGMNYLKNGVLNMAKQTLSVNGRVTRLQRKVNGHLVINLDKSEPQVSSDAESHTASQIHNNAKHFNIATDDSDSEAGDHEHDMSNLPSAKPELDNHKCSANLPSDSTSNLDSRSFQHSSIPYPQHGNFQSSVRGSSSGSAAGRGAGKHPEDSRRDDIIPPGPRLQEPRKVFETGTRGTDSGTPEPERTHEGTPQGSVHGSEQPHKTGSPGAGGTAGSEGLPQHDERDAHAEHPTFRRSSGRPAGRYWTSQRSHHAGSCSSTSSLLRMGTDSDGRPPAPAVEGVGGSPPNVLQVLSSAEGRSADDDEHNGNIRMATGARGGGTCRPSPKYEGGKRVWRFSVPQDSNPTTVGLPDQGSTPGVPAGFRGGDRRRVHLRHSTRVGGEEVPSRSETGEQTKVSETNAEHSGRLHELELEPNHDPDLTIAKTTCDNILLTYPSSTILAQHGSSIAPTTSQPGEPEFSQSPDPRTVAQSDNSHDILHETTKEASQVQVASAAFPFAETSAALSTDPDILPPSWEEAYKINLHDRYYVTATAKQREEFADMLKKLRPLNCVSQHVTRIIEFCCDEDSEIGIQGSKTPHVEVLRCTLKDDVTTKQGMQRCVDYVREFPGTHLFASIPCTPWSPIQELNIHQHGQSFEEYLAEERRKSLKLMGKFITLARIVRSSGGTVCFEWPKGSTGWNETLTQRWIKEFSTTGILFDGCFFELRSRKTGELIKKPWRFETDNWAIRKAFENSTCIGGHVHQPCEGSETKASGHYPPRMARNIVLAFKRYDIHQQQLLRQEQIKVGTANLLEATANAVTQEETKAFLELSSKEQQQLLDAAKKVHVNTGHQPPGELARLLRKNGAPPASRAAMEQVKCSSCHEHKRPEASPVASLSTSTIPWKVLGMDVKEYKTNTHKLKYLLFVDEATRLVKAKLLFKIPGNQHRNATSDEIIRAFETEWEEYFGCPEILRHDPEGSMVSTEIMQAFSSKGIRLLATAGEAHWQLGITERTIQTIFRTAEKIRDEQKVEMEKAVSLATAAQNTTERVHGYSPSQWAFGRNPTWSNTLHEEKEGTNLARDSNEAFQEHLRSQIAARKCFEEEILRQKIQRAQRAKHRKDVMFIPGELVFIWRLGTGKLAGTKKTGLHKGAWIGPGIVLGTESREHEGVVFPTAIVWVVINDRLWRCAPEQLRRASEREHAEQTLNQVRPWTFENISRNLILGQYRNVAAEPLPEPEHLDIHDPANEGQPAPEDMDEDDEDMPEHPLEPPGQIKRNAAFRDFPGGDGTRYSKKQRRKQNIEVASFLAQTAGQSIGKAFFNKADCPEKVLEISFPILETDRHIRKYLRNPEAFVVTSLRKKRVEIVEKRLNPEERELIRTAKGKEIKEFLKEAVVARLQEGEVVEPHDVMKMRWVLTWKQNDDGSRKGKARLVVLGFQDPHLGTENTSAPTLNRRSKQLLLQTVVQNGWSLKKGDVTAAFLQGRPLQKCKYALAPTELAEAMGLPPGDRVIRLLKSVYGLTTAPLEWYSQVDKVLKELGGRQTAADPCVWIFCNKAGEHIGLVGAHVDDFLIAGDDNQDWKQIIEVLLTAFRWTPWEERTFKQCGILIEQLPDGSIVQHQEEYLAGLEEIPIDTERSKMLSANVTESERTQLRALLGGLQWLVTQTRVDATIDVNLLQSCVTTATVETILTANKILRKLRAGQSKLFNKKINEPVHLVAWSDASWANRRDGKSTGGFIIGICGESVLDGKRDHVSIVSWGTNKLKRVARSSMAAEMQALANAEDELHLCRLAWLEFNGRVVDLNFVDECLHEIPGTVVIDAKSIYDSLTSQNQPTQLSEKRTALELLAYLRNTEANGTLTRWVHGGANLADGLTKLGNHPMLQEFLLTSTWALVNDASQLSGKRRKAQGLDTLAATAAEDADNFVPLAWKALNKVWPSYCDHESSCASDN